jgi:hypothetical protein
MKLAKLYLCSIVLVASAAFAEVPAPLEPVADLHRAVHQAFGLPEPVIVQLLDQGLPPEELPAVGLIAARARVEPARVIELRNSGLSYVEVSQQLGVSPDAFYVQFQADPGPPYTRIYSVPRERWNTVVLSDREVVDLSNLQLISNVYRVPPARAIELRNAGKDFVVIHQELARGGAVVQAPGAAVVAQTPAVVVRTRALSERSGYNLEGDDYSKIYLNTLGECQEACAREDLCRAYTYNTRQRMCYLKDEVGRYSPREDTVSGQKGG